MLPEEWVVECPVGDAQDNAPQRAVQNTSPVFIANMTLYMKFSYLLYKKTPDVWIKSTSGVFFCQLGNTAVISRYPFSVYLADIFPLWDCTIALATESPSP